MQYGGEGRRKPETLLLSYFARRTEWSTGDEDWQGGGETPTSSTYEEEVEPEDSIPDSEEEEQGASATAAAEQQADSASTPSAVHEGDEGHAFPVWMRFLRSPFVIAFLLFGVWIGLFYPSSLYTLYKGRRRIGQLEAKKEHYDSLIRRDSIRLQQLRTDDANLERFAREQYYMKQPDEDIYVVE